MQLKSSQLGRERLEVEGGALVAVVSHNLLSRPLSPASGEGVWATLCTPYRCGSHFGPGVLLIERLTCCEMARKGEPEFHSGTEI